MNKMYEMVFAVKGHIYPNNQENVTNEETLEQLKNNADVGKIRCFEGEIDKANMRINASGLLAVKVEAKDKVGALEKARMCFAQADFGSVRDIEITRVECVREQAVKEQTER